MNAEPVLKWVGGKRRLLPDLLARVPAFTGRYFEPFCGGAALFYALVGERGLDPARAVLADANADLIAMYRALGASVEGIIATTEIHRERHSKDHYLATRRRWNEDDIPTRVMRAAAMLYISRACFNGIWRVNASGGLNSPWGKRASVAFDVENLRTASALLRRVDLRSGDFRSTLADAERGDFAYLDSPYVPLTATANFTSYAAGGFGPDDQHDLADLVRSLTARGVHVLASNSDTPLVRSLYAGMRIDTVRCDRRINSKATGRGEVNEVIVVGEPQPRRRAAQQPAQLTIESVLETPQQGAP